MSGRPHPFIAPPRVPGEGPDEAAIVAGLRAGRLDALATAFDRWHGRVRVLARAHFFADAPKRALAAWDEYLGAYPRGTFAPEARYNRALCLVRLGRTAAAAQALRPIAASGLSGYRRREACLLLRWLAERDGSAVTEPSCAGAD